MTTPITPRDWEFLSAYLDGELKDKEKKLLEDRVREDENLRLSLESLQQVRAVLRSQPIQRAPRNFTLTPVMAGMDKGRSQAAPVFRVHETGFGSGNYFPGGDIGGEFARQPDAAGASLPIICPTARFRYGRRWWWRWRFRIRRKPISP